MPKGVASYEERSASVSCRGRDFQSAVIESDEPTPDVMSGERLKLARCRGLLYSLLFEKEGGDAVTVEEIRRVLDATGDGGAP